MKWVLLLCLPVAFLISCTTSSKLSSEAIRYAIVGQKMRVVGDRLGLPTKIINAPEGEKIMVYELRNRGSAYYQSQANASMPNVDTKPRESRALIIDPTASASSVPTTNNYTTYEVAGFLKVYINKEGFCYKVEEKLTPGQMEEYYQRFKQYIPEEKL